MVVSNDKCLIDEALRVVEAAKNKDITLRLLGALAIRVHTPKFAKLSTSMGREISDIDLMGLYDQAANTNRLMEELGYKVKWGHWGPRRIFESTNPDKKTIVDVFFNALDFCHRIDFSKRLGIDYPTVALADILLEKLQIVTFTEKDTKDVIVMLREHGIGESNDETVDAKYISKLLSKDWGFYYTSTTNLKNIKSSLPKYVQILSKQDTLDVSEKIDNMLNLIEQEPKSLGWKMRAKTGTRVKWYQTVENPD